MGVTWVVETVPSATHWDVVANAEWAVFGIGRAQSKHKRLLVVAQSKTWVVKLRTRTGTNGNVFSHAVRTIVGVFELWLWCCCCTLTHGKVSLIVAKRIARVQEFRLGTFNANVKLVRHAILAHVFATVVATVIATVVAAATADTVVAFVTFSRVRSFVV